MEFEYYLGNTHILFNLLNKKYFIIKQIQYLIVCISSQIFDQFLTEINHT